MKTWVKINRSSGEVLKRKNADALQRILNDEQVWLEVQKIAQPVYNADTHKLEQIINQPDLSDLSKAVSPTAKRVETWQSVALTAEELATRQHSADELYVATTAGQKAMWILVTLITKLIETNVIVPDDFDQEEKQIYRDMKAAVERIKT